MIDFNSVSECLQTSLLPIVNKIQKQERINNDEALVLYNEAPLSLLGSFLSKNFKNVNNFSKSTSLNEII